MKTPEQVLKEWASDRITFSIGNRRFLFSEAQLGFLVGHYFADKIQVFMFIRQRVDSNIFEQRRRRLLERHLEPYEFFWLGRTLRHWRNKRWLDPKNFARFESIEDVGIYFKLPVKAARKD